MAVEVPVGDAVHGGHEGGSVAQQRLHGIHHAGYRMRLQRNEDLVLWPELGGNIGAVQMRDALFPLGQ